MARRNPTAGDHVRSGRDNLVARAGGQWPVWGIVSAVFGALGVFILAPVFVPLALVTGTIALLRRQYVGGLTGIVFGAIGFVYLWGWLIH